MNIKVIAAFAAAFFLCFDGPAFAGCGNDNPGCVVVTAPVGTSDNRAASTQFVQQNIASPTNMSAAFDAAFGSTRGGVLERAATAWGIIAPGTAGLPFVSGGAGADPSYQALTAAGIAAATITSTQIASGTITGGNIASATVANSNLANMAAKTVKSNNTASPATPGDNTTLPNPFSAGTSLYPVTDGFYADTNSLFLANTLAAENVTVGTPAATSTCCTWLNTYLSGVDAVGVVSNYSIHPSGTGALWTTVTAARSSDTSAGTAQNIIPLNSIVVHDNTSVGHQIWAAYYALYVAATAAQGHYISQENSIFNNGAAVAEDPFNVNPTGSSVAFRADCADDGAGHGGNDCGAAIDIVNNGAKFITGINIGDNSLDTAVNANPPAISLPIGYAVKWYSSAGTVASLQYANSFSVANGANQALGLGAGLVIVEDTDDNSVAQYMCSGGTCVLGTATGSIWVASTTTPAAGKMSVAFNGSEYTVYNNEGAARTVHVNMTWTNPTP